MNEEDFDEITYNKLLKKLDDIPTYPFPFRVLKTLWNQMKYSLKKDIIIKDSRENQYTYYYSNIDKNELSPYVKQKNNKPITLNKY